MLIVNRKLRLLLPILLLLPGLAFSAQYSYNSSTYDEALGVYNTSMQISGHFVLSEQLPSYLPSTDVSGLVTDYTFSDGTQQFTPANSTIIAFYVATGTSGNIIHWGVAVWGVPLTTSPGGSVTGFSLDGQSAIDNVFIGAPCASNGGPGGECDLITDLTGGTGYGITSGTFGRWICNDCAVTAVPPENAASEFQDAPGFPEGVAQITRGPGGLTILTGVISPGIGDTRDSFCVRIEEPAVFTATTHGALDPSASGGLGTRLFLFDLYGAPLLANENPYTYAAGSVLRGISNDGGGAAITRPGNYILTIAGPPDEPLDANGDPLFDISNAPYLVLSPESGAGRFDHWAGGAVNAIGYNVVLFGAERCQHDLDAVTANYGSPEHLCQGDNGATLSCSDINSGSGPSKGIALGFINGDAHLDAVITVDGLNPNKVCMGSAGGAFTCSNMSNDLESSSAVALGDMDGDGSTDAVIANILSASGTSNENRVCLNYGGGFSCSNVSDDDFVTRDVALAYLDADRYLDAVFANESSSNRVCLGDGAGGFTSCSNVSDDANVSTGVVVGMFNNDSHPDAVFANFNQENRICLGDGSGGFSACSDVSSDTNASTAVAAGNINGDQNLDVIFSNEGQTNRLCFGNGSGGFSSCQDVSVDTNSSQDVALGLVNNDNILDVVFANNGQRSRVCIGYGFGYFECSDVESVSALNAQSVALGELVRQLQFRNGFEQQ